MGKSANCVVVQNTADLSLEGFGRLFPSSDPKASGGPAYCCLSQARSKEQAVFSLCIFLWVDG